MCFVNSEILINLPQFYNSFLKNFQPFPQSSCPSQIKEKVSLYSVFSSLMLPKQHPCIPNANVWRVGAFSCVTFEQSYSHACARVSVCVPKRIQMFCYNKNDANVFGYCYWLLLFLFRFTLILLGLYSCSCMRESMYICLKAETLNTMLQFYVCVGNCVISGLVYVDKITLFNIFAHFLH